MLIISDQFKMKSKTIVALGRAYAPYIVLPIAMGFVGYNIEEWLSDKHAPYSKSAMDRREERQEKEAREGTGEFKIPATIFEKNVSPGLERKD